MDGADSEAAPSQHGLDGDDTDEDVEDALPRQLAAIGAEDPYVALDGGYVPEYDLPDFYREDFANDGGDFVPDHEMQDEYRPIPTRVRPVPSRLRGRSAPVAALGHTAGRFDPHDVYGSSPFESSALDPVTHRAPTTAPVRPPRSRGSSRPRKATSPRSAAGTVLATTTPAPGLGAGKVAMNHSPGVHPQLDDPPVNMAVDAPAGAGTIPGRNRMEVSATLSGPAGKQKRDEG